MTALRELVDAKEVLDALVGEQDGELTPAIEAIWDQLQGDINEKAERWALWLLDRTADAKKLKDEEQRIASRRKAIEHAVERSKEELQRQLERAGKDKVNGLLCTVGLQNNVPSVVEVVPTDEADFRNLYMLAPTLVRRVPETYAWEKTAIKDAAKAGTLPEEVSK